MTKLLLSASIVMILVLPARAQWLGPDGDLLSTSNAVEINSELTVNVDETNSNFLRFQSNNSNESNLLLYTSGIARWNIYGKNADLIFRKAGNSSFNALRIKSDGKIGIGTNSPFSKFHVAGSYTQTGKELFFDNNDKLNFLRNAAFDGGWKYLNDDEAEMFQMRNGEFNFYSVGPGSADTGLTWRQ
ncbi:MAG: hypothetical protein AAGA85_19465, partial [Bacteroidota bacterium]